MKDKEVKVGGVYWANVSGKRVKVKILNTHMGGYGKNEATGWNADNLMTRRIIHILSGRRLLGEVRPEVRYDAGLGEYCRNCGCIPQNCECG